MERTARGRGTLAFTLPEVLIVIAILATLLTMLLPSLTEARDRTRITMCATNLKQWGTAYSGYASDYNGFFGGCTVYIDLVEVMTSRLPEPNNTYWTSPFAKSTRRLPSYGLQAQTRDGEFTIATCPGRESTNYILKHGDGRGLRRVYTWMGPFDGNNRSVPDYWPFAGFATGGHFNASASEVDWGWTPVYGWNQSDLFSPVTHLRQRRSSRALMVMDRSWVNGLSTSTYFYNDIGDTSSHVWRNHAPVYPGAPQVAAGGNALLLDGSVHWMNHTNKNDMLTYGRDYCRTFYVHRSIVK